jgi:hypothetical protein
MNAHESMSDFVQNCIANMFFRILKNICGRKFDRTLRGFANTKTALAFIQAKEPVRKTMNAHERGGKFGGTIEFHGYYYIRSKDRLVHH